VNPDPGLSGTGHLVTLVAGRGPFLGRQAFALHFPRRGDEHELIAAPAEIDCDAPFPEGR